MFICHNNVANIFFVNIFLLLIHFYLIYSPSFSPSHCVLIRHDRYEWQDICRSLVFTAASQCVKSRWSKIMFVITVHYTFWYRFCSYLIQLLQICQCIHLWSTFPILLFSHSNKLRNFHWECYNIMQYTEP